MDAGSGALVAVPPLEVCWGVCVVCVGLLVPVGLQVLAGLPRPAYRPSGLLGAFQPPPGGVVVDTLS